MPSLATFSGSMPSRSPAARTASVTGTFVSSRRIPTPLFPAISWRAEESPPRVGSFMATTAWPPASSAARISPLIGATSERRSPSSFRSWRAAMMARPWSPTEPVTRMRSPGRRPQSRTIRAVTATPVVLRTIPSISPRPITFVSPVTIRAPASRQASAIEACTRSRSARGNPSSRIAPQVRARTSVAPIMARSLTVPQMESRPMSPPGKKIGCTTWESVVTTSQRSPIHRAAPSSIARGPTSSAETCGASWRKTSSIRARIARPPAPCFRVMRCSRKASPVFITPPGPEGRRTDARSCSSLPRRPCRRRQACRERTPCRRACSRRGRRSPT